MRIAPIVYTNKIDEAGRKCIVPKESQANILCWAFNQIAEGVFIIKSKFLNWRNKRDFQVRKDFFGLPSVILSITVKYLFLNTRTKKAVL